MVMDYFVVALLVANCLACLWVSRSFDGLKKENERLNRKLQRNNPRDAHGRFTKDK